MHELASIRMAMYIYIMYTTAVFGSLGLGRHLLASLLTTPHVSLGRTLLKEWKWSGEMASDVCLPL